MRASLTRIIMVVLVVAAAVYAVLAQSGADPFPQPIGAAGPAIRVNIEEFARLPMTGGPPRMMLLVHEPGTRRYFVNDMRGPLYSVSEDGMSVRLYLDINAQPWGVRVQSMGNERGFQSFAFHPQFGQAGTRGFGKFYTYADSTNMMPAADFTAGGGNDTHDTVLLEWTAKTPGAAEYDGGAPREVMRLRQPFANHNAGQLAFNPLARPGGDDYGLLYMGVADGGSGGDPMRLAQNLGRLFGKIARIDPLGSNSANGRYGIPAANPFVSDNNPATLGEIYAYGVRNPQRFGWDPRNGNLFLADIGQGTVEEITLVPRGGNLGWNDWEGSFRFVGRQEVGLDNRRGDAKVVYPVVEYGQNDPLLQSSSAVTGVVVARGNTVPQLANMVVFGDNPSGEVFAFSADTLPSGGQDAIRRVLFTSAGKTLLQLISEKQGPQPRADLRFGNGPDGQIFLLNKRDGVIRLVVR